MNRPAIDTSLGAFERFKQALEHLLSVSKDELKRREEKWKKRRDAQRKRVRA